MISWTIPGERPFDPPLDVHAGDRIWMWVNPDSHAVRVYNETQDSWHVPVDPSSDFPVRD